MRRFIATLFVAALVSSCATVPAERIFHSRIYNLSTGEVMTAVSRVNMSGQSIITAGPSQSGETFTGEGTSIENATQTTSRGSATASNAAVPYNTYVRSSSYSVSRPGFQTGSAILVGTQGTVIDAVYRVALNGTGEGEGRDNKGATYRIQFSQQ